MRKIQKEISWEHILIGILICLNVVYCFSFDKCFHGDFDLRWMECAYTLKGVNPFESINNGIVLSDIGKIPDIAGSMPWAYLIGNVLVFGFLPLEAARLTAQVIFIIISLSVAYILMKNTSANKLVVFISVFATWSITTAYIRGNYGVLCAMFIVISIYCYKKRPVWAGILLALSMIKPQIGSLFAITYLLMGQWSIVLVAALICLLSWLVVAVLVNCNPIQLLLQIWLQGKGYNDILINSGVFTILRNFGIPNSIILVSSACVGIIFLFVFFKKLYADGHNNDQNSLVMFLPAALLQPIWFYSHPYDLFTLIIPVVFLLIENDKYYKLKDSIVRTTITLQCLYGYIIWEKLFYKVLICFQIPMMLSRDIALLMENIGYIAILMYLVNKITKTEDLTIRKSSDK